MAGAGRMEAAPVSLDPKLLNRLLDSPHSYDFFQAVHLLEAIRGERAPVGEFSDPREEVVRFSTPATVGFPASSIQGLEDGEDDAPAEMKVNFLGLTGPQGLLPIEYTLYAASRGRAKDHALKDFFGLFEHRIISLFYRAWAKSHAAVTYGLGDETDGSRPHADRDHLTGMLLSLVGLATEGLRGRLPIPDESLLYYAGLLALPSRPAVALEQLIGDYFGVPCEVQQFVGSWYPLTEAGQTALDGPIAGLGAGAVAMLICSIHISASVYDRNCCK